MDPTLDIDSLGEGPIAVPLGAEVVTSEVVEAEAR